MVVLSPVFIEFTSSAKQLTADITIKTSEHTKEIKIDNFFNLLYPFIKVYLIVLIIPKNNKNVNIYIILLGRI